MGSGSDGGGSIRMPASCCGLVGLKPTRFRMPVGPGTGNPGISMAFALTRTVRDTAVLLDAVHGPDAGHYGAAVPPARPYTQEITNNPGPLRIAMLLRQPYGDEIKEEECLKAVLRTGELLKYLGHQVTEAYPNVSFEFQKARIIVQAAKTTNWIDNISATSEIPVAPENLEPLVYEAYEEGRRYSAVEHNKAEAVLNTCARTMGEFMKEYDVILSPTMGELPAKIGEINQCLHPEWSLEDWVAQRRRWSGFSGLYNATGQPSLSIPLMESGDGHPVGIMMSARMGEEGLLLALAAQLERELPWSGRKPAVYAGNSVD